MGMSLTYSVVLLAVLGSACAQTTPNSLPTWQDSTFNASVSHRHDWCGQVSEALLQTL